MARAVGHRDRSLAPVRVVSLSLLFGAAAVLAGLAMSGGRMASAQAPDQGYWLPAESAVDGGDDYWIPPDSEMGLPILWPPDGGYVPLGGGEGPTVKILYPRGPGGEYPGLCPLKKPPDNRGILVRAQGTPDGGTYTWSGTPEANGPNAFYTYTTCGLTYAETVTYTIVQQASATSGYLRVFDADLTFEGADPDAQCNVEAETGFFMAVGTRKCLTLRLQPEDPDDVMPDEGEYKFNEGLNPRGLLPPYQVTLSATGGSCVDFYDVPQEGTALGSDDLRWGWQELDPQGHPDEFTEVSVPAQRYVQAKAPGTCTVDLWLMFRCPEECGDWLTDGGDTSDHVKITVVNAKLKQVTFSADPDSPVNYFSVGQDTNTLAYPTPHWLDANGNGDVSDAGDNQSPVCYKRNTKMAATVTVTVGPPEYFTGAVKIRGDGPGNLVFPATDAPVAGGEATTVTPIKCANPFPNCVTCYVGPDTPLAISWQISRDGGASWIDLPTQSKNDAFIILDQPQAPQALPWKSVLEKATFWAAADTQEATAIADLAAALYDSGLTYDGGQSHYEPDQWPSYTKFTFHLKQVLNDWNKVDCQDVSMLLTCLASSTGCTLTDTRRIQGPFTTNSIKPIGAGWTVTGWNFHHIGWQGNVYDACEKLKQSAPYLPINVDIATPYKVDLYDFGTWSPQPPFTLGSTDPYRSCPSDVD